MKPIRIMHFGDVHLGVETYGKQDPETGLNTRILDFRRSLNYAIDKALEAEVDLALFAGDAYKSRDPNQTHQREFALCIRRLADAEVPVVLLTGNHDVPNSRARANSVEIYRTLGVANVHVISKPEVITVHTKSGPIQVAGMPYLLKSLVLAREEYKDRTIQETTDLMVQKYTEYIEYLGSQVDAELPAVLLAHFWIRNARVGFQTSYLNVAEPEVLVSAVAHPAFDYVAMGHIHKFQDLNKRARPPVVYCGSIDRIDFSEKDEEKGFVLADVAKASAEYAFVPVPARRFVEIDVDADVEEPTERIVREIAARHVEDAVVKVVYRIPQDKLPLIREAEIRDALAGAFLVVSVTRDVVRDKTAARNRLLTESVDPTQALELYFDSRDDLRKRKPELMEYARVLIRELVAEEQTGPVE